MTPWKLWNRPI